MSQKVTFHHSVRICISDAIRKASDRMTRDPELLSISGPSQQKLEYGYEFDLERFTVTFRFAGGLVLRYWVDIFERKHDWGQYQIVKILARYYPEGSVKVVAHHEEGEPTGIFLEKENGELVETGGTTWYETVKGEKVEKVLYEHELFGKPYPTS